MSLSATMAATRGEQRLRRKRASGGFASRPVHGRLRLRRRKSGRRRKVLFRENESGRRPDHRTDVATGPGVHAGIHLKLTELFGAAMLFERR